MTDKYTEQDIQDLRALLADTLFQLRVATGHANKKCECERWTGICLLHGSIRGSELCPRCDGVRCFGEHFD